MEINLEEIKPSSRRYPAIIFDQTREAGDKILEVENLSKSVNGELLFSDFNINVNKGDKIERGMVIGTVGSTGGSTAPHLHYEVIKDGVKINPVNYILNGLNNHDYMALMKLAKRENQSFD